MEAIKSINGACEVAEEIIGRMAVGQIIGLNAITLRKVDEFRVKVAGAEYAYAENAKDGRAPHEEMHGHFTSCELGDLVFYPERKRVNDALPVVERELASRERCEAAMAAVTIEIEAAPTVTTTFFNERGEQTDMREIPRAGISGDAEILRQAREAGAAFIFTYDAADRHMRTWYVEDGGMVPEGTWNARLGRARAAAGLFGECWSVARKERDPDLDLWDVIPDKVVAAFPTCSQAMADTAVRMAGARPDQRFYSYLVDLTYA